MTWFNVVGSKKRYLPGNTTAPDISTSKYVGKGAVVSSWMDGSFFGYNQTFKMKSIF